MTDLNNRLREIERNDVPDLWPAIATRAPRSDGVPARSRARRIGGYVLVAVVAVVVAAGIVLPLKALLPLGDHEKVVPRDVPTSTSPPRPTVAATIPVGVNGQTSSIASGGGYIWVSGYGIDGGSGVDKHAILKIDPASNRVVDTLPVDIGPGWEVGGGGLTYAFDSVWVTGYAKDAIIERVDPTNGEVRRIPLGGKYESSDVYATSDAVWVALDGAPSQVVRVDPSTNQVTGRVPLQEHDIRRIVATDGSVIAEEYRWEKGSPSGIYTAIDPDTVEVTGRFETHASLGPAGDILVQGGRLWGTSLIEGAGCCEAISPLDPLTGRPQGMLFPFGRYNGPRGFIVADDAGFWYGAYPGGSGGSADRLSFMDATTGEITQYGKAGGITATLYDGDLWWLNFDGTVTRVDLHPEAPAPDTSATATLPVVDADHPVIASGTSRLGDWTLRLSRLSLLLPGTVELDVVVDDRRVATDSVGRGTMHADEVDPEAAVLAHLTGADNETGGFPAGTLIDGAAGSGVASIDFTSDDDGSTVQAQMARDSDSIRLFGLVTEANAGVLTARDASGAVVARYTLEPFVNAGDPAVIHRVLAQGEVDGTNWRFVAGLEGSDCFGVDTFDAAGGRTGCGSSWQSFGGGAIRYNSALLDGTTTTIVYGTAAPQATRVTLTDSRGDHLNATMVTCSCGGGADRQYFWALLPPETNLASLAYSRPGPIVPDVVGMRVDDATTALEAAGLQVGRLNESPTDAAPAGTVLAENPAASTSVEPGTVIDLRVSAGAVSQPSPADTS